MYTRLCSGVLFPFHERIKRHSSVSLRRELERTQWLRSTELAQLQLERLRKFLDRVRHTVPYYRAQFADLEFEPRHVSTLQGLERLPFLTKTLIRENTERLKSQLAARLIRYNTGGSTGEPLVFFMGPDRVSHDVAAKWRATRWWGVDIGDPEIVLWGSPIELGAQDRLRGLRDRAFRSRLLEAFAMSSPRMDEYLELIRRFKPRMIFGYASAVARLARHAQSRGFALDGQGVRVVFVTGETLYPDQRELIELVFAAPVANGYGSRDAGFVAHQCASGSLHLSSEHIIVELVDAQGVAVPPGVPGEVVVTHLATQDFPFIRYRTGDVAVRSVDACSCGRGLPVLEAVHGRSTDFIYTRSGAAMHALSLIYEVRDVPGVRAFKFVQAEDFGVELQLVAGPELTESMKQRILAGLARRLGADTAIELRLVEEIQPEKSGKYRYVVSRAKPGAA